MSVDLESTLTNETYTVRDIACLWGLPTATVAAQFPTGNISQDNLGVGSVSSSAVLAAADAFPSDGNSLDPSLPTDATVNIFNVSVALGSGRYRAGDVAVLFGLDRAQKPAVEQQLGPGRIPALAIMAKVKKYASGGYNIFNPANVTSDTIAAFQAAVG